MESLPFSGTQIPNGIVIGQFDNELTEDKRSFLHDDNWALVCYMTSDSANNLVKFMLSPKLDDLIRSLKFHDNL